MNNIKKLLEVLKSTGLPCVYGKFNKPVKPPYLAVIGNGQTTFKADNTFYTTENNYQIEYYFKEKREQMETLIEQKLLEAGYLYERSEDIYIDDEDIYLIYYYI